MEMQVLNYEVRRVLKCGSSLRVTIPWSARVVLDLAAGDYLRFDMEPKTRTAKLEKFRPLKDPMDQPKPIEFNPKRRGK